MNPRNKAICLQTILTLVMASGAVAIGFTTFVQAEIKEDLNDIQSQELINREKINAIQLTQAEMNGKINLILDKFQSPNVIIP